MNMRRDEIIKLRNQIEEDLGSVSDRAKEFLGELEDD